MRILSKTTGVAAALVACAACTPHPAGGTRPTHAATSAPLSGSDCLDADMVRSWTFLDERRMLVDAGRFKYLIELPAGCLDTWAPVLQFRGGPIGGRVCGGPTDAIITRDKTCRIEGMRMVGAEEYKALESDKHRRSN